MESLRSKADALVFAINKATDCSGLNRAKAEEIYDYITSKIDLPDVEFDASAAYLNNLNDIVSRYGEAISQSVNEK